MREWLHDSTMKDTAFKITMRVTNLLLPKSIQISKSRDNFKLLEQRIDQGASAEILELLQ